MKARQMMMNGDVREYVINAKTGDCKFIVNGIEKNHEIVSLLEARQRVAELIDQSDDGSIEIVEY